MKKLLCIVPLILLAAQMFAEDVQTVLVAPMVINFGGFGSGLVLTNLSLAKPVVVESAEFIDGMIPELDRYIALNESIQPGRHYPLPVSDWFPGGFGQVRITLRHEKGVKVIGHQTIMTMDSLAIIEAREVTCRNPAP